MSRGTARPQPAPGPARLLRWLAGVALLLGALYVAIRLFIDPAWALPAVVATLAATVLLLALGARRRWRRGRTLGRLVAGSPTGFEETVARTMARQGFRNVRRTGGAGDLAADIVARDRAGRTVVVQCKRYQPGRAVGSREMQTFIGMQRIHHEADYGLYVTTSSFTGPARELAAWFAWIRHGITLVDGAALTAALNGDPGPGWMRR